jgi:hypothetical protein
MSLQEHRRSSSKTKDVALATYNDEKSRVQTDKPGNVVLKLLEDLLLTTSKIS